MYVQTLVIFLSLLFGAAFEGAFYSEVACGEGTGETSRPFSVSAEEILRESRHWREAEGIVAERGDDWAEVFRRFDLSPAECQSIIFPELMRYSALQDAVEEAALLSLYVRGGKELSDFSIGQFQMKPSFAEEVEAAWMASPLRHEYQIYFPRGESREARRRRVERLADDEWQCVYIAMFVRLLLEREPSLLGLPAEDRVALVATSYNYSFSASLGQLRSARSRKYFHLSLFRLKDTPCYSYAEIAVVRFKEIASSLRSSQ